MKRVRVTVTASRLGSTRGYGAGWELHHSDTPLHEVVATKAKAIQAGRRVCRRIMRNGGLAQLIVKNRNGRIAYEWTYPRSSDPRPKPGSQRNRG